jgi:hypothetical protein
MLEMQPKEDTISFKSKKTNRRISIVLWRTPNGSLQIMDDALAYAGTVKRHYEAFVAVFESGEMQELSAGYRPIQSDTAKVS